MEKKDPVERCFKVRLNYRGLQELNERKISLRI
jgi:hypothetical protein